MADQDLAALWDGHCRYEFETRDVEATMATMVDDPYVNHVPTMTGGVGQDQLKRFYKYHFIGANPDDTRLIPISRTVAQTASWTRCCSASPTRARSTGCCPASRRQ